MVSFNSAKTSLEVPKGDFFIKRQHQLDKIQNILKEKNVCVVTAKKTLRARLEKQH